MRWERAFYSTTGTWWGPAESRITETDHKRLEALERLGGPGQKRVLDLGSSYGATAAVFAQAGHDVVGVEISDRISFARPYEDSASAGSLTFIQGDFYDVTFPDQRFDVITYWNGFGTGSDRDQRRLLRRMADEWLQDDGVVLLDVANPVQWIRWAGDEEHRLPDPEAGYRFEVSERTDFDPVQNRFVDTWWETSEPHTAISQRIRCYSPPDLLLLLEGTSLQADHWELDGQTFDPDTAQTSAHALWTSYEYLVRLRKAPGSSA